MDISPTTITIVGVVCVALGILAGLLINSLLDGSDEPAPATDEAPPGGRKGRYTPVFRVWREKGAGTLVVEMDGKAMIAPDPLNEIQREHLERTVRDLRVWLGMGLAAAQASQADPANLIDPADRVDPARPVEPAARDLVKPVDTVAAPQVAAPENDLRRMITSMPANPTPQPTEQPQPAAPTAYPTADARSTKMRPPAIKGKEELLAAPAAKSIVLQIEDILQDMIAGTPLETRGVHLMEDPFRGVIVQVGLEHFEGIDAVSDPHVKGIIQSAVKAWEQSQ